MEQKLQELKKRKSNYVEKNLSLRDQLKGEEEKHGK